MTRLDLFHLPFNLQQGAIHTGRENVCNTVCAIYDQNKKVVVIAPEYRDFELQIYDFILSKISGTPSIIYGDCFSVDTWDKKIEEY